MRSWPQPLSTECCTTAISSTSEETATACESTLGSGDYGLGFASSSGIQSPHKIEGRQDDLGARHPAVECAIFNRHECAIFSRR